MGILKQIIEWCKGNAGETFRSPRRRAYPFEIDGFDIGNREVDITFVGGKGSSLSLHYWMIEAALNHLSENIGEFVAVGAKPQPPYIPGSIEEAIWNNAPGSYSTYRVSSHICDIIVASGFAEYGKTINPKTGRKVQAAKLFRTRQKTHAPMKKVDQAEEEQEETLSDKERFREKYGLKIIDWVDKHLNELIQARLDYSWDSGVDCVKARNELSRSIILSRIENSGGLDLETLDNITRWGFNRDFPLQDEEKALEITREVFDYLDHGDIVKAANTLMSIDGVGISRASKVIGLFNQYDLCIYDSRVGTALKDLTHNGKKLIPIPPGYGREGDNLSSYAWAMNYEKLLWIIEIMRDHLNQRAHFFRSADIDGVIHDRTIICLVIRVFCESICEIELIIPRDKSL
ncbi:MAG: hypothetical protein ACLFVP_05140 [Candidatus Bathyarchaeia archaeon]